MEWKKIRQKTFLLLCMTVVLFFLLIRAREGEPGKKGERAEILEIPAGKKVVFMPSKELKEALKP